MEHKQPFETHAHSLTGYASIDFGGQSDFNELAIQLIPNYNPDRFEPIALRFFIQHKKPIITFYVLDKFKQEQKSAPLSKLPTKKIKITLSFEEFLTHIKSFNVTVTNKSYDVKDIRIMNK